MKRFLLFILIFYPLQIAQAKTTLTYKVFAGGVNAVEAKMSVERTPDTYKLFFEAHTRGFLGKLAPWSGSFESYGHTQKKVHTPQKHTSISTWRKEKETKEFFYTPKGIFKTLKITEDGIDKSPGTIDKKLTDQTIDLLAATMNIMRTAQTSKTCEGKSEIFDGKRRFELMFKPEGTETLTKSRYNIYSGNAIKCSVEIKPLAGKWHKKPRGWLSIQEQGRQHDTLPAVWFGQVEKNGLYMPVKIRVKTNYGTLFMHLKRIEISDDPV